MVVRREPNLSGLGEGARGLQGRCPAFEHDRPGDGAAHRAAHPDPIDRRSRVENHALLEPLDDLAGRADVDQHGVRGEHPLDRGSIGGLDPLRQPRVRSRDTVESVEYPDIRARRRRPCDVGDRHASATQVLGEAGQTDVHYARSVRKQVGSGQFGVSGMALHDGVKDI